MTRIKLGQLTDWVNLVRNANAQGYRISRSPAREAGLTQFSVERDDDTGALEVYGWDQAGMYGTLVGYVHDARSIRARGEWGKEVCCE